MLRRGGSSERPGSWRSVLDRQGEAQWVSGRELGAVRRHRDEDGATVWLRRGAEPNDAQVTEAPRRPRLDPIGSE
jgi:hypothetical protein